MSDFPAAAKGSVAASDVSAPPQVDAVFDDSTRSVSRHRRWRHWLSAALFALVVLCFALPFASTSCTAPGGYGRGAQGTSTVYRGVDLALDAVPAVTPSDRPPRAGSLPNDGQLGVQVLALLALLAALGGVALAWSRGAQLTAAYTVLGAVLLVAAQLAAVTQIASGIGTQASLPSGKSQADFVGTGPGFLLALLLLAITLSVNVVAALWQARRSGRDRGPTTAQVAGIDPPDL